VIFFFFFGAIGSFQNIKTFNVKSFFFFFLRKSTYFGSQGYTGLGKSVFVYILLYGFIYFFTVQISWKIFFQVPFRVYSSFFSPPPLPSNNSAVVILSIRVQRIIFPPLELEACQQKDS
jgi:hypothetical protein